MPEFWKTFFHIAMELLLSPHGPEVSYTRIGSFFSVFPSGNCVSERLISLIGTLRSCDIPLRYTLRELGKRELGWLDSSTFWIMMELYGSQSSPKKSFPTASNASGSKGRWWN